MSRPNRILSLPPDGSHDAPTQSIPHMEKAGAYLKTLRRQQQLTQSHLAELVEVGRGTIDRIEAGGREVSVGTVFRVLNILGASPWQYYDLTIHPTRSLQEVWHQQAILRGILAYIRVRAAHNTDLAPAFARTVSGLPLGIEIENNRTEAVSELALLSALISLDAPLIDLAPVIHAAHSHEAVGRQQAEARNTFLVHLTSVLPFESRDPHRVPLLDAVLVRLSAILRYNSELPMVTRHELARVVADIERYRSLVSLAISSLQTAPEVH